MAVVGLDEKVYFCFAFPLFASKSIMIYTPVLLVAVMQR
jgi:hypothetical protein